MASAVGRLNISESTQQRFGAAGGRRAAQASGGDLRRTVLHKTVLQYCVVDGNGNIVHEQRATMAPDAAGLVVFDEFAPWRRGCRVAAEAVGMNRWFLNLKVLGKKTDKRDAREIARRLWLGDIDRDAKTWHPDDEVQSVAADIQR